MIYTTGTVSTVSGSAIVSGTGTKWTVNNPAIRSGTIILIKNGNANFIYMVDRVNSDTELVISQPATFTVKNTSYSINLTEPNSYSDANNRMTAIASDTTYFLRAMDQWMMNNGVVTVELSNGQKVTLDSIKKMQSDISSKADLKSNVVQRFNSGLLAETSIGAAKGDMRLLIDLKADKFEFIYTNGNGWFGNQLPGKNGTLMVVGDYGVGGFSPTMTNNDIKTKWGSSIFRQDGGSTGNLFSNHGGGIHIAYSESIRIGMFVNAFTGVLNYYTSSNNDASGAVRVYTTWSSKNTTVDSNGFIKRASPVININPDGTFTTNDESEGATVTRVAKGEYLIEGVLGFNSDAGWGGVDGGIEIPLDVNKQPLIWVDSKVMEDGSILVKTYHRTHPNAPKFARNDIDGYKDGDPIDIPDGRFISVRVQMPEQSIYNVRMREMEEAQKAEEERRKKEEE
ncbi:hypothetical protein, partial [Proteus mirabilis]|uniref:phage tail fiber protein n=1 Tax=Proteus mirabilis TaxID=584 RepID=UPI00235F7F2B